jgi:vancomycin resistance protein VanW
MLRRGFRALPDTPRALLLWLRLSLRDAAARDGHRYARSAAPHALPAQRHWTQVIHDTPTADSKRHNLRLAADRLHRTTLHPGEVFSFARIVGPPIASRGYRQGRTLMAGEVAASAGGGLCQLSGLLYLAALECGLEVIERHPHSVDIYTDATRFAPLGADATVVYGHRDLRIRNPYDMPIAFRCAIDTSQAMLTLCSPKPLPRRTVAFVAETLDAACIDVDTVIDDAVVLRQRYRRGLSTTDAAAQRPHDR